MAINRAYGRPTAYFRFLLQFFYRGVLPIEKEKKQKAVEAEKNRLLEIFKDIDENKLEFVTHQIDDLAWLNVSVDELKAKVDKYGTIVKYNNGGGQNGVRDNPDVKTIIAYQKNIASITRQLLDLVPNSKRKSKLEDFIL